jgi:phage terminase large subunit
VFEPLLAPSRYKGAWGGRGSGKSHFMAGAVVEHCLLHPGSRVVCIREVQKTLAQSAKLLIENKIQEFGVGSEFRVLYDRIETPGGGLIIFQGMQDQNAESIKSLEAYNIAWCEEAQTLSNRSLALLRPTIRAEGSEIWFSWNARRKSDAVDQFLRVERPDNAIVVRSNWRDNPWFPTVLEGERQLDLEKYPDRYSHVWLGDYARAFEGAYFAQVLNEARQQGRIGKVSADPLLPLRLFWDIGGAGAKADACAIWVVQWVAHEIRVLDYIEGQGQVLGSTPTSSDADHLRDAEFKVEVIPNQGAGAAAMRIEAVRRIFPKVWFNEATTEAGRDALGFYHAKKDENRDVDLGPEHDWSSHAADAFGLMAVAYKEPSRSARFNRKLEFQPLGIV